MIAALAISIACSASNTSCLPNGLKNIRDTVIVKGNNVATSSAAITIMIIFFFFVIIV
jgi:hypothetical protein